MHPYLTGSALRGLLVLLGAAAGGTLAQDAAAQALPRVIIQTELGDIEVEVDSIRAPVTATNFLRYVDLGFYRFGRFHRTLRDDNQPGERVKIAVIHAGLERLRVREFPAIPLERTSTTGLSHRNGTISMARDRTDPATSGFFICIGDQPALDFGGRRHPDGQGFAAFGRVVLGMDVVTQIHQGAAEEQELRPPVKITNIVRKR